MLRLTNKNASRRSQWVEIVPQVLASTLAASMHTGIGQIIAYSGVIVPQMIEEQNGTNSSGSIPITESDKAWIGAIISLFLYITSCGRAPTVTCFPLIGTCIRTGAKHVSVGNLDVFLASAPVFSGLAASMLAGMLADAIGRLRTVMLASVFGIISHALIATASSISIIIWGRILVGFCWMFIINPTAVYISEISRPDVRGLLLSFMQVFMTIGMLSIYLEGWFVNWRTIAWLTIGYILIPTITMFFIPESPAWLVSKLRFEKARQSLAWFQKYSKKSVEEELLLVQKDQSNREKLTWKELFQLFLLPTFYKPFLILTVIFCLQQFSGAYVILFNCVIFFEEIGTDIDPYLAAVAISGLKVVISFGMIVLMKRFRRRVLMMVGSGGMVCSMAVSGLYTRWLQQGTSNQSWIVLGCLLLYVIFSSIGIMFVPFILAGEVFPVKIRGTAYSMLITMANVFTFSALQCYFPLHHALGGSSGLQFFFAAVSLSAMLFSYLFLPETHNYKLIDNENYFWNHTIYKRSNMLKRNDVLASVFAALMHIPVGQFIAYSGVIVPQMIEEQNRTNSSGSIPITESDSAWIASAPVFSGLAGSILAGVMADAIGRLRTLMLARVFGIIAHVLIATASSISVIIWGRIFVGVCWMFTINPTAVYISEISRPDVRGLLLSFIQMFTTIGMLSVYLEGWFLNWRTIAWLTIGYILISTITMFFIPESPAWLVSKLRFEKAKQSLAWFHKYSKKSVEEELLLVQNDQSNREKLAWKEMFQLFLLPTFYKPFLILAVIFCLQQFSGAYVILFNCVIFFEEIGTDIDPYLAAVAISGLKVVISFGMIVLMKRFRRRVLMMVGFGGMVCSMAVSGMYTRWLQQGTSHQQWIVLSCLLLYVVFSSIGPMFVPFAISGEIFSVKIRGTAYSMLIAVANLFTFFALQCYFPLHHALGGSSGLQFFFAAVSLSAMVFSYLFLPETHNYKLIDNEIYFRNHTIYKRPNTRKRNQNADVTSLESGPTLSD
ncbi:hypothetical protein FQR65_LT00228 [Abscondita terminalis]|nr:hypothetical protein FQR65_LT00228 [Abscondita terminalis]